jgi:drug/metabolite transporter (DMT)-like permease
VESVLRNEKTRITLAMISMYLIWGSTFLGSSIALESLPPLLFSGVRFLVAGGILFSITKIRGADSPSPVEWRNAALVGILMLGCIGSVTVAQQWVASGLAAVAVASIPLWTLLFSILWKERPAKFDWLALLIGFCGVVLLNLEDNLRGNPVGALLLIVAPIAWALGSNLSKHLKLPPGGMGFAAELLAGGAFLSLVGLARGENLAAAITTRSLLAWFYLVVFGSLIAFTSYMYLLNKTRLAVATSYAYVNPIVALFLGILLANEPITYLGILATFVIVSSVAILSISRNKPRSEEKLAPAVEKRA